MPKFSSAWKPWKWGLYGGYYSPGPVARRQLRRLLAHPLFNPTSTYWGRAGYPLIWRSDDTKTGIHTHRFGPWWWTKGEGRCHPIPPPVFVSDKLRESDQLPPSKAYLTKRARLVKKRTSAAPRRNTTARKG